MVETVTFILRWIMNVVDCVTRNRSFNSIYPDRRKDNNRRGNLDRRDMIRFDETGGDRRSGYAGRSVDEGFRENFEQDPYIAGCV